MRRNPRSTRRKLGFETLEQRQLMAGDVSMAITDLDLEINGPSQAVDLQITDFIGYYKVEGLNGTTVNGHNYQYIHNSWVDDVVIDLPGVDNWGRGPGSSLTIEEIDVSGDLEVEMSHSDDELSIANVEAGGSVRIATFEGDDEINFGGKNGNFNVVGRDLRIASGSGYDDVNIIGTNVVKDDVAIDAGDVGIKGSAEFLNIQGLKVGGYGVNANLNDLTITAESHVELDMRHTDIEHALRINASATSQHLELDYVDVGGHLRIWTGDGEDTIELDNISVGRDLEITTDNYSTKDVGVDHLEVNRAEVGGQMTVKTGTKAGSPEGDWDWIGLWQVDVAEELSIDTGSGHDVISLSYVEAESADIDGGEDYDVLSLLDSVFEEWSKYDNFEEISFG